jgi:hypothetical protein
MGTLSRLLPVDEHRRGWSYLAEYYLSRHSAEPIIYVQRADRWIAYGVDGSVTEFSGTIPTSVLERQLWERIEQMRREGRSILLTTHSMEEAQAVCDRVAIMDHGKILTVDSPAGLIKKHRNDPRVRAVAHGRVTLDDVFIGLTGADIRE